MFTDKINIILPADNLMLHYAHFHQLKFPNLKNTT
uniref:Uncharacterized protein n=1 Tax=Rhizophora mucronata TaxID=61149 RepID=A0A2P2N9W0_RHIMU